MSTVNVRVQWKGIKSKIRKALSSQWSYEYTYTESGRSEQLRKLQQQREEILIWINTK